MPCDPSASASACCGRGWACLSNGICENVQDVANSVSTVGQLDRAACTDQLWASPECPKVCQGEWAELRSAVVVTLQCAASCFTLAKVDLAMDRGE